MLEHPIDAAPRLLGASAPPATRLEVVWQAFEFANERTLRRPPLVEFGLFASWTPAAGQHAMTLPPPLIAALAGADGVFWMDVYPEGG